MADLEARQTRCTLCSLSCALGFERTPGGSIAPGDPQDVSQLRVGICGRGHLNYELMAHPLRLGEPLLRQGGRLVPTPLATVADAIRPALTSGRLLVVADGSLPCEDLAASAAFASVLAAKADWTVYQDPADEALLTGVAASGVAILTPENLAECDAVLSIGDAFGTHPVISRPVHAVRRQDPRRAFIVIDSVRTRTGKLATTFLEVRPGTESAVLRFLAGLETSVQQAAQISGLPQSQLEGVAGALGKVKRLGVLAAPEFGKAGDWEAVGALAGLLAKRYNGGVTPLPAGGNSWGGYNVAKTLAATPLARTIKKLIAGEYSAAVVLGVDLVAQLPLPGLGEALERLAALVVASVLRPTPASAGTCFLPMATNIEVCGTVVNGSGEVIELTRVTRPAGGALSARALLEAIRPAGAESVLTGTIEPRWLKPATETSLETCLAGKPVIVEPGDGRLTAVGESGCVHKGSGAVSMRLSWPQVFESVPTLRVSRRDADELGLADGATVEVASARGSARLKVVIEKGQRARQVGLWTHAPEVRALFDWKESAGPWLVAGPVAVTVKKV